MVITDQTLEALRGRDWMATAAQLASSLSKREAEEQSAALCRLVDANPAASVEVWKRTQAPRRVNAAVFRHSLLSNLGVTALGYLMVVAKQKLGAKAFVLMVREVLEADLPTEEVRAVRYNLGVIASDDREVEALL